LLLICNKIIFFSLFVSSNNMFAQVHADFSAANVSGCSPITVNFTNQSTGATAWQWDLGNGTISSLKEPSATYITPGTYTVKLTASNGSSSDVVTKINFITVFASPTVAFSTGTTSGCYPLSVPFTDQSTAGSGNIVSWQWDFGDGNISTLQNPTHIYQSAGAFNVILTVKNSNGCVKTITKQNLVNITNGVFAFFDYYTASPCSVPVLATFINYSISNNVTNYFWDFGDGQTSTDMFPLHLYTAPGLYTVSLTATSANGCNNTYTRQNGIMIGVVKADFSTPSVECAGVKFTISNLSKPTYGLQHSYWDFGDGTTDTIENPTKKYNAPGTYTITLKAINGNLHKYFYR
jgi:PKD repeat protein